MNYRRTITRQHRTAYILLLDASGSMQDVIEHEGCIMTKGQSVVESANTILQELYFRAYRDGEIRNYYDIAVVCYSGRGVYSLLDGQSPFVPISELSDCNGEWISLKCLTPLDAPRDSHGAKIVVSAEGCTPTCEALDFTYELLSEWCARVENFDSASPTVFNITDGHATDGDLEDIVEASQRVMSLRTNGGNVLMLNIHLSGLTTLPKVIFPTDSELEAHPNAFFRAMGYASSIVPESFVPMVHEMRASRSGEGYRGVGFNVSVVDMISMMNIGTLSVPVG